MSVVVWMKFCNYRYNTHKQIIAMAAVTCKGFALFFEACGDSRLRGLRGRKPIGFRQWVMYFVVLYFLVTQP